MELRSSLVKRRRSAYLVPLIACAFIPQIVFGQSTEGPDLEVISPTVSNTSPLEGGSFTLSATVSNAGDGASAATTLRYYRSADATISSADLEVGTDAVGTLAAGGTSPGGSPGGNFVVLYAPSPAGTYYYGACVDAVTGESDTTNNCSASVTVEVEAATTFPDLEVGQPTVGDSTVVAGGLFRLSITVTNIGDRGSGTTTLRYYQSTDATISSADTEVGTDRLRSLGSPAFASDDVTAPLTGGTYYYGACVDAVRLESDTTNNCSASVTVEVVEATTSADLQVSHPTVTDSTAVAGGSFTLSTTVSNAGDGASEATTLRYYLLNYQLTDGTISNPKSQVGTDEVGTLAASETSAESISLTARSTAGTYYYGVCVDSVTNESDTTNNCSSSVSVVVSEPVEPYGPDLEVDTPTVDDSSPETDASFTLSATVRNAGDESSVATTLRYYRSTNTTISSSDTEVGTDSVGALSASATSAESVDLTAPSTAGTYYYGACVDSVTDESDTNNNCSSSVSVVVSEPVEPYGPDLEVISPTVSNTSPLEGGSFTLSATVSNAGDGASAATTLRYYRSADATISSADLEVGTDAVGTLAAGGTSPGGSPGGNFVVLYAPSPAGTYYYGACVDAVTGESDTTNNCSASVTVEVEAATTFPDLEVGQPTVGDSTVVAGGLFRLSITVTNIGDGGSGTTTLRYYQSTDATISSADTEVGTDRLRSLGSPAFASDDVTAPLTGGTYYYGACVDAVRLESDTTNNCSASVTVEVVEATTSADLQVSHPTVTDSTAVAGGSFTLSTTVSNAGDGASEATTLRYYLLNYQLTDGMISNPKSQVGTDEVGTLAASETSAESISLTARSTAGTYYYGVCVDSVTNESDTTNNCSSSVSVVVSEPVEPYGPDLEVDTPTVDDSSPETDASFTLSATVRNAGDESSVATTLRYYRSTNTTISSSDTEVGTDSVGALSASATSAESVDLTAPSTAGTYYYGACVDSVTDESDTNNNCSSSVSVVVSESQGSRDPNASSPAQVTGVVVTPGIGELAVTWKAVPDADGYQVQWKSGEENYDERRQAEIAGGKEVTYTITELQPGIGYTVRVTADHAEDGTPSHDVTGIPKASSPTQVTGVVVTPSIGELAVAWKAVLDADGYQIQWKSGEESYSESRQMEIAGGETVNYTITELQPGIEYAVRVIADHAEDGTPSHEETGIPKASSPAQVTGVLVEAGAEALEVSWMAVSDAGGYKVQWKSGEEDYGDSRQAVITGGDTVSHTITGLASGTEYSVRVIATKEDADVGTPSAEVTGTPRASPPAEVTGVEVTSGVEQLEVSWTAVEFAGGYKVQWKSGTEEYDETRQAVVTGGDMLNYTITELPAGATYAVRVIASKEQADEGVPSAEVAGIPKASSPAQVTGVLVEAGAEALEVSWMAVSDAGGYKVQWKSGEEDYGDSRQAVITGGDTVSHTITGLASGTEYSVRVIATKEDADVGTPSAEVTGTPRASPPAEVTGVEVTSGVEQLEVSWTAVEFAGGYKVQWKSGTEEYDETRQAVVTGGDMLNYTITELPAGATYAVRVIASKEQADEGVPSAEVAGIPKASSPAQVTGVLVEAGAEALEVSWMAVSDAGGYKVQWKSGAEDYGDSRQAVIAGGDTVSHTITGLAAGTEYSVRVIATKEHADDGTPSAEVTGTPRASPPAEVTGVEVTSGVEQLEVSWTAVEFARGYKVQWKSGTEEYDETRQAVITGGDTVSHMITGLAAGTEYAVRVIATKEHADDGAPSAEATGTPKASSPAQVTGVEVALGVEQLEVSWTAVSDAGGYKVQWKSGAEDYGDSRQAEIASSNASSYTIADLEADTEYTIRVIATKDNADDGAPSAEVTGTPTSADPDVNGDGVLNGDDAVAIYHSYTSSAQLGDGETGGTPESRQSLLAGYSGKTNPSDDDLKAMIRKANAWKEAGVDAGGDINEDGVIDESDAFMMYYAYATANLVGDGETGGTARFRQLLLAAFANKENPTDEDLKAMLRRANKLREGFG